MAAALIRQTNKGQVMSPWRGQTETQVLVHPANDSVMSMLTLVVTAAACMPCRPPTGAGRGAVLEYLQIDRCGAVRPQGCAPACRCPWQRQ